MAEGIVKKQGGQLIIELSDSNLMERRYAKVKVTIHNMTFTTFAGSSRGVNPGIIIPTNVLQAIQFIEGSKVSFDLQVITSELPIQRIHSELEKSLREHQLSLDHLSEGQRRQLLSSVNEAKNPQILHERIQAVLDACRNVIQDD